MLRRTSPSLTAVRRVTVKLGGGICSGVPVSVLGASLTMPFYSAFAYIGVRVPGGLWPLAALPVLFLSWIVAVLVCRRSSTRGDGHVMALGLKGLRRVDLEAGRVLLTRNPVQLFAPVRATSAYVLNEDGRRVTGWIVGVAPRSAIFDDTGDLMEKFGTLLGVGIERIVVSDWYARWPGEWFGLGPACRRTPPQYGRGWY